MDNFKKILAKTLMVVLPLILIMALFILFFKVRSSSPSMGVPTPSEVSPTPESLSSTHWATDSAILEIEENFLSLQKELEEVDLKHADLQPPVLDMNVGF